MLNSETYGTYRRVEMNGATLIRRTLEREKPAATCALTSMLRRAGPNLDVGHVPLSFKADARQPYVESAWAFRVAALVPYRGGDFVEERRFEGRSSWCRRYQCEKPLGVEKPRSEATSMSLRPSLR